MTNLSIDAWQSFLDAVARFAVDEEILCSSKGASSEPEKEQAISDSAKALVERIKEDISKQ